MQTNVDLPFHDNFVLHARNFAIRDEISKRFHENNP
jgi:hypothetical protein